MYDVFMLLSSTNVDGGKNSNSPVTDLGTKYWGKKVPIVLGWVYMHWQ